MSRLSLTDRILIVKLQAKFENYTEVQRQWRKFSDSQPPNRETTRRIFEKFDATGNVKDLPKPGRPRSEHQMHMTSNFSNIRLMVSLMVENPKIFSIVCTSV